MARDFNESNQHHYLGSDIDNGGHFRDRRHAGRILASKLEHFRDRPHLLVLALPRGGVPVAVEVAHALEALLDIYLVRKLGFPGQEEVALGAIASGGVRVMNPLPADSIEPESLLQVVAREEVELARREQAYRGDRPAVSIEGRTVIVVDDGVATGASMQAVLTGLRQMRPAHLAVAVPVGAPATCDALRDKADEVVCALTPEPMRSVGQWYEDFTQVSDEEVNALLSEARREHAQLLRRLYESGVAR
jgi:putative phosphoribosyl transferase